VTEIFELSKLSKAYISQVKHGNRTPSKRLLETLAGIKAQDIGKGQVLLAKWWGLTPKVAFHNY
jgi:transcriptional regulator with XRE-family HTH domain